MEMSIIIIIIDGLQMYAPTQHRNVSYYYDGDDDDDDDDDDYRGIPKVCSNSL